MALVAEKLASDATLDKVLCICSGCQPIKSCTKVLANKGPSCGMVTAESGMDFAKSCRPSSSDIHRCRTPVALFL